MVFQKSEREKKGEKGREFGFRRPLIESVGDEEGEEEEEIEQLWFVTGGW